LRRRSCSAELGVISVIPGPSSSAPKPHGPRGRRDWRASHTSRSGCSRRREGVGLLPRGWVGNGVTPTPWRDVIYAAWGVFHDGARIPRILGKSPPPPRQRQRRSQEIATQLSPVGWRLAMLVSCQPAARTFSARGPGPPYSRSACPCARVIQVSEATGPRPRES